MEGNGGGKSSEGLQGNPTAKGVPEEARALSPGLELSRSRDGSPQPLLPRFFSFDPPTLQELGRELSSRLGAAGARGSSLTLKLKRRSADAPAEPAKFLGHGLCDNFSKSANLPRATDDPVDIARRFFPSPLETAAPRALSHVMRPRGRM